MACRVKLNKDGSVISVERPDGSPSTLYPEALRFHEDEEKALEMVAYQELEDFNNVVNYDVEPTLKQVQNYIHYKNAKASKVSPDDVLHITDFMGQADVNTIEELDELLHDMFRPDGFFEPDVAKMVNSGIYTQVEAENLLTNDLALDSLISMIEKVSGMQLRDEALETNNVSLEQKLKDTSKLTPFGTYAVVNDYTIEREIVEATKGVDNFEQFKKNIMSLNVPHIVEQILEDDTFAFELFNKYKNYKEVRSAFITDNQLVAREDGHYEETLKGTILQGQDNTKLLDKIGTFMAVSMETKLAAIDSTIQLVKEIEKEAANLNIDIIGLNEQSLENITVMLDALTRLTEDAKVDGLNVIKVENFADIHQSIFNPLGKSEVKYELLTKNLQNKKLIRLNTEVSNEVLFEEFGLLKVGDNLYHHLSKDMTVDDLYDELYNKILRKERPSPTKIPDINDPFNKPEVLENLKSYINRLRYHSEIRNPQLRERATLLSVLFNHPIESKVEEEVRDLVNITSNEQYLKTDFISDFYNYYLKEKLKDSKLYRDVLSNFEFNNKDLTIKDNSLEFLNRYRAVAPMIPLKEALEDYARLKKEDSIRAIAPAKETTKVITDMGRFVNNPQLLDDYNRPVEVVGDYLTADTSDNFIKYNDTVYMRVGAGVFMSLPNNPNKTYYTLDYKVSPDQSTINLLERQPEPAFNFIDYNEFQDNIFNVSDPKFDNMVAQLEAVQDPNVKSTFRITEGDSVLNFSFKFGRVELDMIQTPKGSRGKGQARKLMERFTEALDAQHLESNLYIQPRDKDTTAEGLQSFFESFGYIEGDLETSMDRFPGVRAESASLDKDPVIFSAYNVTDVEALKEKYEPVYPNEFYHHSTNEFRPKGIPTSSGLTELKITGRLTTDKVDVLLVENPDSTNENPHITLSTAEGVKPFASNEEIANNLDQVQALDDVVEVEFANTFKDPIRESEATTPSRSQITEGATVVIEDRRSRGNLINGQVAEILTRSETHPYGILVRLTDGTEGRVKSIPLEEVAETQTIEDPTIDQLEVGDSVEGITMSGTIIEGEIAQVLGINKYGNIPIAQFTDGRILDVQRVFKNETRPKSEEYLMKENIMKTINRLSPIQDNVITYSDELRNNPHSGRGRVNISYYSSLEDLYKIEEFVNEITENADHKKILKTALEYGGIISLGTMNNYEIAIGDTSDYYSVTIDYYNGTFSTRNRETNRESYDVKPGSVVTAIKKAADKYNTMPESTRDKEGLKTKRAQDNRNKKGLSSLTEEEIITYRRRVPYLNPALAKLIDNKGTADNIVRVFPTESKWYPIIKQISEYKELSEISLDFLPPKAYQGGTYKTGQGKAPAKHLIDVQRHAGEDLLVHELIHGISVQELRYIGTSTGQMYLDSLNSFLEDNLDSQNKTKAAAARLVELYLESAEKLGRMEVLKKHANVTARKAPAGLLGDNYGFLNIKEFIAEAFSDIRFQERLNSIESDKVTGQTLLGRFIQLISDLLNSFGKTQLVDGNILKEVVIVSETIFEGKPTDMSTFDFTSKASDVYSQMNNPITVENLLTTEEENSIETCR